MCDTRYAYTFFPVIRKYYQSQFLLEMRNVGFSPLDTRPSFCGFNLRKAHILFYSACMYAIKQFKTS